MTRSHAGAPGCACLTGVAAIDALIAATVLQHDVIQVTRNLNDFQRLGVMMLNPWTA
ncbi:hypothetical protein NB703_003577 [Pantoea ananatis]|jgi:hypothetical protein|uniref:Type II toxin-antitoxin system VapC family toxin n=1 Tax=Pantoea ananas TaxID=553 RepID=A0AAJ1D1E5_PANAN|nr:hypothetical protein [Pantoea ananatis]MCW0345484.1 hypothetical protein [Pantoea ananatis]